MSALTIAAIVFGLAFGAGLLGLVLHEVVPDRHLDGDSKDVVKLVMGLIATMSALVLSLLISSANSTFQAQSSALQSLSANVVLLDQLLGYYGPETRETRAGLRQVLQLTHDRIWPKDGASAADLDPTGMRGTADLMAQRLQSLAPTTDAQRAIKSMALQTAGTIAQTRLLMFEQIGGAISWPFLAVLVFWICILFLGFGLFARVNATVLAALLVGSLSVAGAIFLILELSEPYRGLMRLSDAPLEYALEHVGR